MAKRRKETTERVGSDTRDRLKLFILSHRDIMVLLTLHEYEVFALPIIEGLPRDAKIHEVEYRMECRGWAILVEHESFPTVAPQERVPYADTPVIIATQPMTRNADGSFSIPGMYTKKDG